VCGLTALASGSGDHAGLARLAEEAGNDTWIADGDCVEFAHPEARGHPIAVTNHEGTYPDSLGRAFAAFIAAANPATVLALLAENAALRGERDDWRETVRFNERCWSEERGVMIDRATEAERKLAEAREIIQHLEWSCEQLAATRSQAAYDQMMSDGQAQALLELDNARRAARTFLSKEAERG